MIEQVHAASGALRYDRDQSGEFRRLGFWPDKTVYDYLVHHAQQTPHKVLIVDREHRVDYRSALMTVDSLAAGLQARGVGAGDVVSVQLPNWRWFPLLEWALAKLGAACNPLPTIYRHRELRFMLGLVKPRMVVTCGVFRGFDHAAMMDELRREMDLGSIVIVDGDAREGMEVIEDLLADPAGLDSGKIDPDSISEIAFTSGTTGEAKGVMHTHNSNLCPVLGLIKRQRLHSGDVVLMASTFGHNTGFVYGGQLPVVLGGAVVLMESWDPARALSLIEGEGVTWFMGATPFLSDLCEAVGENNQERTRTLRTFLCSGAPIPRSLLSKARRRLGCAVVSGWGMTEIGLFTLSDVDDRGDQAANSDGYIVEGGTLLVLDDHGQQAEVGEEGDIVVKGPTLFSGYFDRAELTRQSFGEDGWFATGDRGRLDGEGNLRITGRSKDIIVRGGENIPIVEVEDLLHRHPRIRNVAIVGIPDPRLQERACAVVIPADDQPFTLADIISFLEERQLAKQFFPEFLVIRAEFPTTPSGKIQKFLLRQEVSASFDAKAQELQQ